MSLSAHKRFTAAIILGFLPTTLQLTNEIDGFAAITTTGTTVAVVESTNIDKMLDGDYSTSFV